MSHKAMYSEKEIRMFEELNLDWITEDMEPSMNTWRVAIEKIFLYPAYSDNPKAIESLKRTGRALAEFRVNRLTPEFDKLIEL